MSLAVDLDHRAGESDRVEAWRLRTLIDAGYPVAHAELLATLTRVDLHRAVKLLEHGCPADLAFRILT